jgi:hypothetical protein
MTGWNPQYIGKSFDEGSRKNSIRPPDRQLRLCKATNTHGSQSSGPQTHGRGTKMAWMEGILRRDVEGPQKEYHRNLPDLFCCPKVLKFLVGGLFSGSSWDSSRIFLYAYRVDTEKEENII